VATLLTRVEVDPLDPAFGHPTKFIGPVYTQAEAQRVAAERQWSTAPDGSGFRRVVASPQPLRVLGLDPITWLLEHGALVIAAGGGGIPVARQADGKTLYGVDAVIDKDLCSGLLARDLRADCLVIATDVDAVYLDWGKPDQRALGKVTPHILAQHEFPDGSMGPKVAAACQFVLATGKKALIGSLDRIEDMLAQHEFPDGSMGPKVAAACQFVLATGKKALIGSLDRIEDMLAGNAGTEVSPHAALL
jgi:carbamate kinase